MKILYFSFFVCLLHRIYIDTTSGCVAAPSLHVRPRLIVFASFDQTSDQGNVVFAFVANVAFFRSHAVLPLVREEVPL